MRRDQIQPSVESNVAQAIAEDLGEGDVSAALIPATTHSSAVLISRESGVLCGQPWADETAKQIGAITIDWQIAEGSSIPPNQTLAHVQGPSRNILSAERVMLNFLQLLSGTATRVRTFYDRIRHTDAKLLDTRKTLPGLRIAQKYAVSVGGGLNHRVGLFDAYLIKENHIAAAGSIEQAVQTARADHPELPLEVEVETLNQLKECVELGVPRVLLDNFATSTMHEAVATFGNKIELEASGGINLENIATIAETGVDFISVGSITKDVVALDLSLRFNDTDI